MALLEMIRETFTEKKVLRLKGVKKRLGTVLESKGSTMRAIKTARVRRNPTRMARLSCPKTIST